ncbi:MAG: nitronate monooxygenase [Deltaproteobacteria bacterium]|nr:nitronate monooxygenase [Deltaproteobacteria bacterium]
MFKTLVCDILGIEYPIILGGMVWIGKAKLAGAVSEAGGLGLLATGGMTVEEVIEESKKVRDITTKPFGINVPLARPDAWDLIEAGIKGGATAVSTSAGSPKKFTAMIKDAGCTVMHVVPSVSFADKCADAGVDIIVAEGIEAGGHDGFDEITTMALVPQVVDRVSIPVVAAGGIADGRGFMAALALGAQGVQMGTRFVATHESAAHPRFKEAILRVAADGTTLTGRTTVGPTRGIKNKLTAMILEAEKRQASQEEIFELIGEGRSAMASIEGDTEEGSVYCGQIGGMIRELKSVREVIDDVIAEAERIVSKWQRDS